MFCFMLFRNKFLIPRITKIFSTTFDIQSFQSSVPIFYPFCSIIIQEISPSSPEYQNENRPKSENQKNNSFIDKLLNKGTKFFRILRTTEQKRNSSKRLNKMDDSENDNINNRPSGTLLPETPNNELIFKSESDIDFADKRANLIGESGSGFPENRSQSISDQKLIETNRNRKNRQKNNFNESYDEMSNLLDTDNGYHDYPIHSETPTTIKSSNSNHQNTNNNNNNNNSITASNDSCHPPEDLPEDIKLAMLELNSNLSFPRDIRSSSNRSILSPSEISSVIFGKWSLDGNSDLISNAPSTNTLQKTSFGGSEAKTRVFYPLDINNERRYSQYLRQQKEYQENRDNIFCDDLVR